MLKIIRQDSYLQVHYRHYLLPLALLILPPLLLLEHGANLLDGSIERSDLAGLLLGIILPLGLALGYVEFGRFRFSLRDDEFAWRWRNLLRSEQGVVALREIVDVRREGYDTRSPLGRQSAYRLVVELDDARVVGLSHGYSGFHKRKLGVIVGEIRDYLGLEQGCDQTAV